MAGAFAERLALIVSADVDGAIRGLKKVGDTADRELGKAENRADKWGNRMQAVGAGMVAFGAVAVFGLAKAAKASEEANLAVLKLSNSVQNNKRLAGESVGAFTDLADAIQDKTAADADAVVAGMAMLGTFKVTGDQLRELTPLVVDYARKFGTDLVTANTSVGKALDGSVGALKRNGVSIDENLFKTDRYAAVMQALREQVGGFAEQEGATFAGSLERLKNNMGDVVEGVGSGAVKAFERLIGVTDGLFNALENVSPEAQSLAGEIATYGAVSLVAVGGLSTLIGTVIKARANFAAAAVAIRNFNVTAALTSPVTLGVGAALGVLAIHLSAVAKRNAEAKRVTDLYTLALQDQTGTLDENIDKVTAAEFANSGFSDRVTKMGGDLKVFGLAIRNNTEDWGKYRDVLATAGDQTEDVAGRLRRSDLAATSFGQELIRLVEAEGLSRDAAIRLVKDTEHLADGLGSARDKASTLTAANEALGVATDDTTESIDESNDALKERIDRLKVAKERQEELTEATWGAIGADLSYREAIDRAEDALAEMEAKTADAAKATGDDLAPAVEAADDALRVAEGALLAQAEAAAKAAEQNAIAAGGIWDENAANAAKRDELARIQATLAPGSPLWNALQGYIDKLNNIPRRINTELAFSIINPDLPRTVGAPRPLAHGGPFRAGEVALVGEKGPELVKFGASGTVIPNNQLQAATMGGTSIGGSHSIVVNVHGKASVADAQEVIDALKGWQRSNGTIPLTTRSN